MKLMVHPLSISDANALVKRWHRTHKTSQGGLFAIGVAETGSDEPCGAIIVGRPVSRMLQDGWTCEVVRCVTDGTRNANSMLYGAAAKAARALGYKRIITYTLESEGGASLRGAGYTLESEAAGGGSWSCPSRPRVDQHPLQKKLRWSRQF